MDDWLPAELSVRGQDVYGLKIAKNSPNAKIAVLYQNDDFGKDLLSGLKDGLGARRRISSATSRSRSRPPTFKRVAKLKATGATVFFELHDAEVRAPRRTCSRMRWMVADRGLHDRVTATTAVLSAAQKACRGCDLVELAPSPTCTPRILRTRSGTRIRE